MSFKENEVLEVIHESQRFPTFHDFEIARKKFEEQHNMVLVTGTSCSVANENRKLAARGARKEDFYKEDLKHKNIKFHCKFGGKQRIRTGKGEREFQSSYKIGCPFLIHLIAEKDCLVVRSFINNHEFHNCTLEEVNIIPERRKVCLEDEATVNVLLEAKVRPSTIRMILRDTKSGKLTPRDIANLRARRKKGLLNGRTEAEMLTDTLCNLMDKDPGVFIHISKDSDDSLEVLFIQTSRMRLNVEKYGMVLLFDHTYKINKNRLPVSIFKVMDGNGLGRCAGIAYVVNEEKITLTTVVSSFKEAIGENVASTIRTVVIDKDYSEAGAVKEVLPRAEIQLCDYHVSNTFQGRSAKEDARVKSLIYDMRYCESDETFQLLSADLQEVASKPFWDYFFKNWIQCPLAWSFRDKKKSPHLGNTTTGRVEKFNSSLKMVLDCDSPLHESVNKLTELVENKEEDVLYLETAASVKHVYLTTSTDPVVTRMLNELTLYAAKKILAEKQEAVKGVPIRPDTTVNTCGCSHYIHTFLPCSHILRMRMQKGLSWYDSDSIISMYKKSLVNIDHIESLQSSRVTLATVPAKTVPKTSTEKYNRSLAQGKKIAALLSECGDSQYAQRFQVLIDLWKMWAKGDEVVPLKVVAGNVVSPGGEVLPIVNEVEVIDRGVAAEVMPPAAEKVNVLLNNDTSTLVSTLNGQPSHTIHEDITPLDPIISTQNMDDTYLDLTKCDDKSNSNQQVSVLAATTDITTSYVNVVAPICMCGEPTIMRTASDKSRIRGRRYWKCGQRNPCQFWRLVKKGTPTSQSADTFKDSNDAPEATGCGGASDISCQQSTADDNSEHTLLDDGENEHLSLLMDEIEKESNVIQQVEKTATDQLREVMTNITLPASVKHRGRPKGLTKTVHNKPGFHKLTKQRKARPLKSLEDNNILDMFATQKRGKQINDSDVSKSDSGGWLIVSQTNRTDSYCVSKTLLSCSCSGPACSKCLSCSCDDFAFRSRKRPCKHVFKIEDMISKVSNGSSSGLTTVISSVPNATHSNGVSNKQVGLQSSNQAQAGGSVPIKSGISSEKAVGDQCQIARNVTVTQQSTLHINHSPRFSLSKHTVVTSEGDYCVVCDLPGVVSLRCKTCQGLVHTEDCSVCVPDGDERLCNNCFCFLCRSERDEEHICICHVCLQPTNEDQDHMCYRCERLTHSKPVGACGTKMECKERFKGECFICKTCLLAQSFSIPSSDANQKKKKSAPQPNSQDTKITNNNADNQFPWEKIRLSGTYSESNEYELLNFKLAKADFYSLLPRQWLNDQVIDCFFKLVTSSDILRVADASIFTLNCLTLQYVTMGVQSIIDRIKRKMFIILDSMYEGGELSHDVVEHVQITRLLLENSHFQCFGTHLNWTDWKIHAPPDIGLQMNGFDCGIFVCMWSYCICTMTAPPHNVSDHLKLLRGWIAQEFISRAKCSPKTVSEAIEDDDDVTVVQVFAEHQGKVADGSIVIERPWKSISTPVISYDFIDSRPTNELLANVLKHLWRATDKFCGAKKCKGVKRDMLLCEACREFFHVDCIGDLRKPPSSEEPYLCPQHIQSKTKTRFVRRPVRLRRSLE